MSLQEAIGAIPDFGGVPTLQNLEFEESGKPGVLQMKSSGRQGVKFYYKEFYSREKSQQKISEERALGNYGPVAPVYEKKLMVRIVTPGDRSIYDGLAEDYHKRNYFQAYARFKDGKDIDIGARLEQAEFIQAPEILELNYLGVYSIQQMAESSDTLCERIPRGFELREGCRAWIELHQGNALMTVTKKVSAELNAAQSMILELQRENERTRDEMNRMKALLSGISTDSLVEREAADAMAQVSDAPKKRGGRPRKVVIAEQA